MGYYAQAQPVDEGMLAGLAQHTTALERRFTTAGDHCDVPSLDAKDPVERLHAQLLEYRGRSLELGKSGHPAFGAWMIWSERDGPLALVMEEGPWLYNKDGVLVKALTPAQVAQVAHALADVQRSTLRALYDTDEMRVLAHWITKLPEYTDSDQGFDEFVKDIEYAKTFFSELTRRGEAALIWLG